MHLDIIEAIRQRQRTHVRSISIENGNLVDIIMKDDGTVVVTPRDEALDGDWSEDPGDSQESLGR